MVLKGAQVTIATVKSFLKTNFIIEFVLFVCIDEENLKIYKSELNN